MTTINLNLSNFDDANKKPLLVQHPVTKQWVSADEYNAYMQQQRDAEKLRNGLGGGNPPKGSGPAPKPQLQTGFQIGRYENGSFYIKNGANPAVAYSNEYEALNALAKKLGIEQPAAAQGAGTGAPAPTMPKPTGGALLSGEEYGKQIDKYKGEYGKKPLIDITKPPVTPEPATPTPEPIKPAVTPEPAKPQPEGALRSSQNVQPPENKFQKFVMEGLENGAKKEKAVAEGIKIGEEATKGSKGFWSSVGSAIKNNKGKIAIGAAVLAAVGAGLAMCSGGNKDNEAELDPDVRLDDKPTPAKPEEETPAEEVPAEETPAEETPADETPGVVPAPVPENPENPEKPEEGGSSKPGAGVEAEGIKVGGNVSIRDNGKAGIKPITGEVTDIDGDIVTIKDTSENKAGNLYKIKVTKNDDGTVSYSVISKNELKAIDKNEYKRDKDGNVSELETSESYGRGLRFEAAA
ncbi:hypothetical protein J6E39_08040 [bacterium]|nr:hypothetical protein [bacterium]